MLSRLLGTNAPVSGAIRPTVQSAIRRLLVRPQTTKTQSAICPLLVRPLTTKTCSPALFHSDSKSVFYKRPPTYLPPKSGPLMAAILDWSGTTADIFVMAPAIAFVEAFESAYNFKITMEESRLPMGLVKDRHIKAILEIPAVSARWKSTFHRFPKDKDADKIFEHFLIKQRDCLVRYAGMIPGTGDVTKILKEKFGLKIGATTGFQRIFVDTLASCTTAENDGRPLMDLCVAGDEVPKPRPWPYAVFRNMQLLEVQNVVNVLKVDDTTSGVGEGLNAGTWTCGVSHTSNYMNVDEIDEAGVAVGISPAEMARRGLDARHRLLKAGAHYVVDDIRGLPAVVEDINRRLANGERPL